MSSIDPPDLTPVEDEISLSPILEAISSLTPDDVMASEAGSDLDVLSSHTIIDTVEASPDGVFWTKGSREHFEAVATIYLTLNYGSMRERDSMSDSYPAYIRGHMEGGRAIIDGITADTASFYE